MENTKFRDLVFQEESGGLLGFNQGTATECYWWWTLPFKKGVNCLLLWTVAKNCQVKSSVLDVLSCFVSTYFFLTNKITMSNFLRTYISSLLIF